MKTAREMIEELGYESSADDYYIECSYDDKNEGYWKRISFDLREKTFDAVDTYDAMNIDIPTFKAIQKQLEELGWLYE